MSHGDRWRRTGLDAADYWGFWVGKPFSRLYPAGPLIMSHHDRQKWNARYAAEDERLPPTSFLADIRPLLLERVAAVRLPTGRGGRDVTDGADAATEQVAARPRALDIAGGSGRHALPLAELGYDVTIADISHVGLAKAQALAEGRNLPIRCLEIDLEESPLPAGPWDLIFSAYYLQRSLYAQYPALVTMGGLLAVVQATRSNSQRHNKPPAHFLLEDGELPKLLVPPSAWEILQYREGWFDDGRHEARLVARRV